jgi:hypothetical protein
MDRLPRNFNQNTSDINKGKTSHSHAATIIRNTTGEQEIKERNVRSEAFTAVTMKNGVFWDVTPCGSCKNRRFGGN